MVFTGETFAERLIGRSMSDLQIRRELSSLDPQAVIDRDEDIFGWISKSGGVQVSADPDDEVIFDVFMLAEGAHGHRQFAGELPGGIRFCWGPAQVRDRLGPPTRIADTTDQWSLGPTTLYVEYDQGRTSRVVLALRR